jgi:predicted RNase H-like HicB family nuclease
MCEPRYNEIDYRISLVENDECIQVHGSTLEEALDKIIDSLTCETEED